MKNKEWNSRSPQVQVTDEFWRKYIQIVKEEMLPFQWNVLHDKAAIEIASEREDPHIPTEKSHVIENFRIAAGQREGNHYGWLFQDSDLYKWIEAAANCYRVEPDEKLLEMMQDCVQLIADAQDEDGYLSTYYQIEAPQMKFRHLFISHELYCAGHLMEAAIAYAEATGSRQLIEVSERFVDCIQRNFGPEEGKIHGADGHQEIELALVRMYEYTGEEKYLDWSNYFLQVRGQDPDFYRKQIKENRERGLEEGRLPNIDTVYLQAHKPVVEQTEAQGHAVRLVYMAQAMAGTAHYLQDEKLQAAAERIWKNIVTKRMYITGGIGSTVRGEAFTFDYDLPTDLMYCETCAAIGLLNFTLALQQHENKVEYADVMEKLLYNGMISGMSLDGKHFFYVNPLEVDPEASRKNPDKSHVKSSRPSWFGCACCPPNLARTLPKIDRYIYSHKEKDNQIWINQWIGSTLKLEEKEKFQLTQQHHWEEKGNSVFQINKVGSEIFTIFLRIPYWIKNIQVYLNEEPAEFEIENGYLKVTVKNEQTAISLSYDIPVLQWQSHPKVKSTWKKIALQRGPFIYCAEEEDNGADLHLFRVIGEAEPCFLEDTVIGKVTVLDVSAEKANENLSPDQPLYQLVQKKNWSSANLRLIPYYSWANRSNGEMRVWLDKKE